ncbi:conserved hypothetical protein [Ricinus communis]|uniref:Uncharacterized protein n=1 Tax=Ricinus communis TaxID=3988 RepID=B9TQM2_RICCO|nr:conserved hypothetical protein [Ricinus communis]
MAHYARIFEVRLIAREDVEIGAADADAAHAQQHFSGLALGDVGLVCAKHAGGFANHAKHREILMSRKEAWCSARDRLPRGKLRFAIAFMSR